MIKKLLYLTYISLDNAPTSGSSVRPLKMKEAFDSLDIEVKTFGGMNNDFSVRKAVVKEIKDLLKTWIPDACYIEPPSGPLFYIGDISIIKLLHHKHIPISIFYRDAYWKYPEYSEERPLSLTEKAKRSIIKMMQVSQWNVFSHNIDLIYFPSLTMAKEFDCRNKDVLPPGSFIADVDEKRVLSEPLQFIFVGGAAKNHGTFLTIDAFKKVNASQVRARLYYICPENQWQGLNIDIQDCQEWLEVIHTSGDNNLKGFYEKSDIALLTAPRTFYRDFAVPVKIFEYISYLKPVLVTNCTETERIVLDDQIGWVTKDNVDDIALKISELCDHPEIVAKVKTRVCDARIKNLWIKRAEKVINDLDSFIS